MEFPKAIKNLGEGVQGTVWLVEISGKKAVCKIEKIPEESLDGRGHIYLEIEFRTFAEKHPNHFMQLQSWEFLKCSFSKSQPVHLLSQRKTEIDRLKAIQSSRFCAKLIYEPVLDISLSEYIVSDIGIKAQMCCTTQLVYALGLMHTAGYYHNDIGNANIMAKITDAKSIQLNKTTIPTFGHQWYLIDYGSISRLPKPDLGFLLLNTLRQPVWKTIRDQKVPVPNMETLTARIMKSKHWPKISSHLPEAVIGINIAMKEMATVALHQILDPIEHFTMIGVDPKYRDQITIWPKELFDFYAHIMLYCNNLVAAIPGLAKKITRMK